MAAGLILEPGTVYFHIEIPECSEKKITQHLNIAGANLILEGSRASINYFKLLEVRHISPALGVNTLASIFLG